MLPALLAAVFAGGWLIAQAAEFSYSIPLRTDTFATTPYAVAILIGFAVSAAIARLAPLTAWGLAAGMLLLQVLLWPARFSQTGWTGYLLLLLLAAELAASTPDKARRLVFGSVIAAGLAVAALLNLPSLSFSGQWGTINGKDWTSNELWSGWAAWSAVITVLTLVCWRIGVSARRRELGDPGIQTPSAAQADLSSLLTPREYEVFELVAQGLTNAEIARIAHISVTTVKTHVAHILAKTGSSSRAKVIALSHETNSSSETPILR